MKEFIINYCETCKKELKTKKEWKDCFHKNHTIRTRGQAVVDINLPNQGSKCKMGIALTNAKAGDELLVRLT